MAASDPVVSHRKVAMGSNRTFGLVFAAVFVLIALLPATHDAPIRLWALAVAGAFVAAALFAPRLLSPLNRVWFALGLLLHHVVNPLVMAVLFYGAILPMALLLRVMGKDLLRLKRDTVANSYWIARDPPGPAPRSMSKQF
jgi:predicted membrane metal-binding protein